MKLLQTYYTSCRIGQTNSSGFQFYSFSEGITESELDEIGKLGSYAAPYGSNPFPTEEEVLNTLPIAFKYFRLSSGRVGVLQSTACTQEYTGRPGNYFTHALLLEAGEFPFMPILLHKSNYLRHDLTEEQKNIQSVPLLLPPLIIDESSIIVNSSSWSDFSVQQFIKQGNNEELLSKLLDIILIKKDTQKRIIIADNKSENIIYILSNALPFENVNDLTFSTYSLHPATQNAILSASSYEGSDFNFDDTSMKSSYYVFNNANVKYADLEKQSNFSKILICLLASEPEKMNELYEYSAHFIGEKDGESIDLIATIFSKQDFIFKWKQILPFVIDKAKSEYVTEFFDEYESQITHLADVIQDESEYSLFFDNLLKLACRLQNSSAWLNNIFSYYLSTIAKQLDSPTKPLVDFNNRIVSIFNAIDNEMFKERFISHDTFLYLSKHAHTELAVMNAFTLTVSLNNIFTSSQKKTDNIFSTEKISWFIRHLDEEQVSSESFHILISEMSDVIDMFLLNISKAKADNIAKRLIRELIDDKNILAFYKMILQGIFDSAEISNVIRAETIRQLEKRALINTPTDEELKVYIKLKKYSDYTKASSIDLILTETNISTLVETMNSFMNIFKDAKKLSVYLDWKKDSIISTLKQSEDWEKYYSLFKYIEFDVLNLFVEKYFEHTMVLRQLVTLIVFSQSRNNKQLDDLLRKILTTMKRSTYSDLKQEIEKGNEDISDYFTSLNKGIQLKRLFNFKF